VRGGLGLLIGTRCPGRMIGEFPGLGSGLDEQGNLRATPDFRGVYSAILEAVVRHRRAAIIPSAASFSRPALLRVRLIASSRLVPSAHPSRTRRRATSARSRMQVTSSEFDLVRLAGEAPSEAR
jgi:hypothetical protein